MTAEIAILNRYGVALAADSAVSIGGGDQPKIYNTVNKLFSLSKRAPIGTMIFGNALMSGFPWETVIKSFRQDLGTKVFDHVEDYAAELLNFVENNQALISHEQEEAEFSRNCFELYEFVNQLLKQRLHSHFGEHGEVPQSDISRLLLEAINETSSLVAQFGELDALPENYGATIVKKFAPTDSEIRRFVFENIPLDMTIDESLGRLTEIYIEHPPKSSDFNTGVVIAGFGELEYTPVLLQFEIFGLLGGHLRRRQQPTSVISRQTPGTVVAFAQREMVDLFMSGIDSELRSVISNTFDNAVSQIVEANQSSGPSSDESPSVEDSLMANFEQTIDSHIRRAHLEPILNAVAALPKEELASMAATLVNLTSFKRRVTLNAETVGGPIDVVVISKGDGLIWVDRKHYFDASLNHHFFSNYFNYGLATEGAS